MKLKTYLLLSAAIAVFVALPLLVSHLAVYIAKANNCTMHNDDFFQIVVQCAENRQLAKYLQKIINFTAWVSLFSKVFGFWILVLVTILQLPFWILFWLRKILSRLTKN